MAVQTSTVASVIVKQKEAIVVRSWYRVDADQVESKPSSPMVTPAAKGGPAANTYLLRHVFNITK